MRKRRLLRFDRDSKALGLLATNTSDLGIKAVYERAPGSGSIVEMQRSGRTMYEARVYATDEVGNRVRRTRMCRTRALAVSAIRELQHGTTDVRRMKVVAFLDLWLAQTKSTVRPATGRLYTYAVKVLKLHLKSVTVANFTSANARALFAKMADDEVSPSIMRECHKCLSRAFSIAVRDEVLARNPLASVTKQKVEPKPEHVPSLEEANRLLAEASKTRWHLLIRLALVTGMRQGEVFAVTPADLRLDDNDPHLFVNSTLTEDADGVLARTAPKTKSSKRRVDLDPVTATMLRERVAGLSPDDLVFTDTAGNAIRKSNFLRRDFAPMVERAGVPPTRFHSLRKITNSHLLASGQATLLDLQGRLGHTTAAMTLQTYARAMPGAQKSLARIAGELFVGDQRGDLDRVTKHT